MTETSDRINALVAHWKPRLGLQTWEIRVEVSPVILWEDGRHVAADAMCTPYWKYLQATLRFSEEKMLMLDEVEFEETVVHEMVHIVLSELETTSEPKEERVTTLLARALLLRWNSVDHE